MSLTFANTALRIMRNLQIPVDSSTGSVTALADVKEYLNERARKVWSSRHWPEYVILGTYDVAASDTIILLSDIVNASGTPASANGYNATFQTIAAVRNGSSPMLPEDMGAINACQADAWVSNGTPVRFVNMGKGGIKLLAYFAEATTLSFFGNANFQVLTD